MIKKHNLIAALGLGIIIATFGWTREAKADHSGSVSVSQLSRYTYILKTLLDLVFGLIFLLPKLCIFKSGTLLR